MPVPVPALGLLLPVVLVVLWVFMGLRVVNEYERGIVFRLGRVTPDTAKLPGLRFIIPFVDRLVKVDLRTLTRDVAQWSQLFMMAALLFIYLYNVRMLPLGGDTRATIIAYANLGMAGFVVAAICLRFAYPSPCQGRERERPCRARSGRSRGSRRRPSTRPRHELRRRTPPA